MMVSVRLLWHGYRYFPYERTFALEEVRSLLGAEPRGSKDGVVVEMASSRVGLLRRLTYFSQAHLQDGTVVLPDQARLESSVRGSAGSARRQVTRYSAHGLHEYRGKFNPQVVRAIGNMLGLSRHSWLLDPFCGSGTTLLEAAYSEWNAVGTDLNPLAALIANAKLATIRARPAELAEICGALRGRLEARVRGCSFSESWSASRLARIGGRGWEETLPNLTYLRAWFREPVLAQLAAVLREIAELRSQAARAFAQVALSDVLREASLQDPGDLRIRRRKEPLPNAPLIPLLLSAITSKLAVLERSGVLRARRGTWQRAFLADCRREIAQVARAATRDRSAFNGNFDAVITSPPYATALPYIDTQRLSICALGLVDAADLASLEGELIGSRELTRSRREELESRIETEPLARSVRVLCREALRYAARPGNGFRKRNVPALLLAYFSDMRRSFLQVATVTRPGTPWALVVGRNRTNLGGRAFIIDTPALLAETAQTAGWELRQIVPMDTYPRFDVHRRNSIDAENLIVLERRSDQLDLPIPTVGWPLRARRPRAAADAA